MTMRGWPNEDKFTDIMVALIVIGTLLAIGWLVFFSTEVKNTRAECERYHGRPCGIVWEPVE